MSMSPQESACRVHELVHAAVHFASTAICYLLSLLFCSSTFCFHCTNDAASALQNQCQSYMSSFLTCRLVLPLLSAKCLLSLQDKRGKLLKNHSRDIRRDTIGGGGQVEAGLMGRWMTKTSKQNATAGQKVADKLARLSPKSLLTMLKKNAGLQPLPMAAGGEVRPLQL